MMNQDLSFQNSNPVLDHDSPIPLHHQITQILRNEILTGDLVSEEGKVPTETELAQSFGVSRITVRTAIETLVSEGLLWRKRGSGTFLKTNTMEHWAGRLMGFSESITGAGFKPRGKVLKQQMVTSLPEEISEYLIEDSAWELKRLRFADEKPIAIEQSFFTREIGMKLRTQTDLDNIVTYQFIENELKIPLSEANQLITAINANEEEAQILNISERDALLYIERLTKSRDGKIVEFLRAKYRPDYFNYVIQLNRQM